MTTTTSHLSAESFARAGSKTTRRELRRDVRNSLGNTNDPAPDVLDCLRAARALGPMLSLASDGRYGLYIQDQTGRPVPVENAIKTVLA